MIALLAPAARVHVPQHWQQQDAQAYWACQRCKSHTHHHAQGLCCSSPHVAMLGRAIPIATARSDHGACGRDGAHFEYLHHHRS